MPEQTLNVYPVLLAGGTGTRLWPLSRRLYPKQLINFMGQDSLVQATIKRLSPTLDLNRVRVVCGNEHAHEIARHMQEIGISPEDKVITEPRGRNTAPAILLAVLTLLKTETDAILCVLPADHVIRDVSDFHDRLSEAIGLANENHIVTFGIKPHYPETGYGYIETAGTEPEKASPVKRFVEKPDRETAQKYLDANNFFWNSGMFVFKASVMVEQFKKLAPEIYAPMEVMFQKDGPITEKDYSALPDISIDYAIMEKTDRIMLIPSRFGWSDIGSWKSLYDFLPKDDNANVIDGDVITMDTRGCFIMGRQRLIAANHLENLVIVDTPDSVFISEMDNSKDVKRIVENLKQSGRPECHRHNVVYYPWGSRTTLDKSNGCQIWRLFVYPGHATFLETKSSTKEHFLVTRGHARIVAGENRRELSYGEAGSFPGNNRIEVENSADTPLIIIRTSLGESKWDEPSRFSAEKGAWERRSPR